MSKGEYKKGFEELVIEKLSTIETDVSWLKTDVSCLKTDVSWLRKDFDVKSRIMDKKIDGLYDIAWEIQGEVRLNGRYINQSFQKIWDQINEQQHI